MNLQPWKMAQDQKNAESGDTNGYRYCLERKNHTLFPCECGRKASCVLCRQRLKSIAAEPVLFVRTFRSMTM